ncbi:MAG: hypothetical protein ACFE91_03840 [Promethearchaeota archaeon]
MIPKRIIEKLIEKEIYIYVKNITKEFIGKLLSITEDDIIVLEDKYNNIIYIPISEITIITERR